MIKKLRSITVVSKSARKTISTALKMRKEVEKNGKSPHDQEVAQAFQEWARYLCQKFNVRINTSGFPIMKEAGLLVGNHMSYMDIPVLVSQRAVTFVAKAEIESWPFFGPAGRAFGAVYVDRSSKESRKDTAEALKKSITEHNRCVCVFPEGTTTLKGKEWRAGVFKIAQDTGVPVQIFAICYLPAQRAAFEVDSMLAHAMDFTSEGPLQANIVFGPVITVVDWEEDLKKWEAWSKGQVNKMLGLQGL